MRNTSRLLTGAILAASVGLGACSDSSGPENSPLTASDAAEVGTAVASTAELGVAAVNPSVPEFGSGFSLFSSSGRSLGGGLNIAPPASPPENCPSPSDLTDSDGDGVPDDAVWTFSVADCTETDIEGNRSVVTGSVTISDPGLTAGYDLSLNALTMQYYENGATSPALQLVMDGDWSLRGTSEAISAAQDYTYALTVQNQRVTLANDLAVNFAAASGSNIAWGEPLPDGTLEIDGAWRVSSSRESHALTLTTLAALAYDAECAGIVGGTIEARGDGGAVRVTWTDCGVYTATFIAD